jgi:hypothetical protein
MAMPPRFDATTLAALGRVHEVEIETTSLNGTETHRTIIWIVASGDEAFVRSVRGAAGRWYREARRRPEAVLHVQGVALPVYLALADDPDSVGRVSDAFTAKYARVSPASTAAMIAADTLEATLRVDPREA